MKCVELNPEGNFDPWENGKLAELRHGKISNTIGNSLLFENKKIRLWEITLVPNQRLPFHKQTVDYSLTCLTDGTAISRYKNGKICLLRFKKGDIAYYEYNDHKEIVRDFENIGEGVIKLSLVEYKYWTIEEPV